MKSTDDARTRTGKKSGQCGSRPGTSKDGDSQKIPEVSSAAVQQVLLARIAKEQAKADAIRARAKAKAARILAKGEYKASVIEQKAQGTYKKKVRLDVHGRPKPLMRGWIHLVAAPLALAAGIVLICLAPGAGLKWACAVFMASSLILFGNSALYHIGDWPEKTTDILRRIDHVNIFLLIAGTYTPVSFALSPGWRNTIILTMWIFTGIALLIHVVWINAPRWLYTVIYIIFGVSGVAYLRLFWLSPHAGPAVVWLVVAGGACYILGAIAYLLRKPDPWPMVFGFHEIFHIGTVAGFACHTVAIYFVAVSMM